MHVVLLYHSLLSDWNHGNAHFLRGIATELLARGHTVRICEPDDAWSRLHLHEDQGERRSMAAFRQAYPHLAATIYPRQAPDLEELCGGADLIIVHEWNDAALVEALGEYRRAHPQVRLLFHDTHHRAVTAPQEIAVERLAAYDGVLVYGAVLRDLYQKHRWARRVWIWHEAADTRIFRPLWSARREGDLVWIGNWGDDERTAELEEFLLRPVMDLKLAATVHGVRYPEEALRSLQRAGVQYRGYLPNFRVPEVYAAHRFTVHIPRRPYVRALRGIPTIRPFEAMACGIPLASAPWSDCEGLFEAGDFAVAGDGREMTELLRRFLQEPAWAAEQAQRGLRTIRARHTCGHRVDELLQIYREIAPAPPAAHRHHHLATAVAGASKRSLA